MSYRKYPEMKDSGVEWIGVVPGHWRSGFLKRHYDVQLGKMLSPDSTSEDDTLEVYLKAVNIQWGKVISDDISAMWLSPKEKKTYNLEFGDLLVSEGGDVGRSAIWDARIESCYFQNAINRVRPHQDTNIQFLYYFLFAAKHRGYIDLVCNKATIAHLTAEKLNAIPMIMPKMGEQNAIANFLDRKTAAIDALIAKKQRQIELLQEKRQIIINNTVTKGLNPNVLMKDSGVEWIGEIPAGWDVASLKRIARVTDCKHYTVSFFDEGYPIVSIREIAAKTITDLSNAKKTSAGEFAFLREGRVPKRGDIIFCRNASVGAVAYVDTDDDFCLGQDVCLISANTCGKFLFYLIHSDIIRNQLESVMVGATFRRINVEEIKEFKVCVPSLSEDENKIVNFLDHHAAEISRLMSIIQSSITTLREYRIVLISNAVTGKIDIREEPA